MKLISLTFFFSYLSLTFASCPGDSIEFQSFCYFFEQNSTQFPDAELKCMNLNGHLASIHDGFTNAILASESTKFFHESTVPDFWVGLNSLMTPGNWSWTDNTTFDFKEWGASEPQNLTMSCGALKIQNGYWSAGDCFTSKPFVCAVASDNFASALPTVPSSTHAYPVYTNCSNGWLYFEPTHSCYGTDTYYYNYNWTFAERSCLSQGAHLVSLHSYDETKFVSQFGSITATYLWTGLYSVDNEASWRWSDGSVVDYLPWYSPHPNRNVSSCGTIIFEKLYDVDCENKYYIVCKKTL